MDILQQLEAKRDLWRRDILRFCEDVLWWRTSRGVEKWTPYPAQAKAMKQALQRTLTGARPRHKVVAFCWPKRQGKSTAAAAILAHSLVCGTEAHSVCCSNSRENAQTVTFECLLNFIRHSPILQALIPEGARQRSVIACEDFGNWVRALPANENTVQGIAVTAGGWAVFDDAHSAPLAVLDMVGSQTEDPEARILVPSMMGSSRGYVHRLWQTSKTAAGRHICFNYWHGPEGNRNPYVPKAFLEQRRAELPGPIYLVLHENEPGEGGDALFELEQLAACRQPYAIPETSRDWHNLCVEHFKLPSERVRLGAGLDRALGGGDETVFSVVARYEYGPNDPAVYEGGAAPGVTHYAVVWAEPIANGTEAGILAAAARARAVFGRLDHAIAEQWQTADIAPKWGKALGCRVDSEAASAQAQATAFNELWQLVNEARFHYSSSHERLHEQLAGFTIDQTGRRLPRFTGGSGKAVDDWVYSVCWATVAARKPQSGITPVNGPW